MVPISEKDCSLVIPAYNEEQRISFFLEDAGNFGGTLIFVCDGEDKTADIIMAFSDEHPDIDIKCLNFNRRLGKGGGVLEGI
ncbi:MAG: glycosyltransferase, partial [Methanogenium sp.]|nr:glycosyltransferase [Methanogenium sp.]